MTTVDRILELVKDSGLTAKEFAIGAGIAGGSITDWKTGRSKPSVESLQRIAKYAKVQLEWLTGDSEFKTHQQALESYLEDSDRITILKTIHRYFEEYAVPLNLNEKDIEALINIFNFRSEHPSVAQLRSRINNFSIKYNDEQKIKIEQLIQKIAEELLDQKQSLLTYHNLRSLIEKDSGKENLDKFYMCPVYGQIAAGQPNWAEECLEGFLPLDPQLMNISNPEECFFLRVNGESMNKVIKNGAYALIRKTDFVENGEIAVVLVDKYDATLKKFTQLKDGYIILEPQSTLDSFDPIVINPENTEIKILGKYIGKMEMK